MRGRPLAVACALLGWLVAVAPAAQEAEVPPLLAEAQQRWQAGERVAVLELLRRAQTAIRRDLAGRLADRLPDEAAGFRGEEVEVELAEGPAAGLGFVVRRRYGTGEGMVTVEIYYDVPFLQAAAGLAANPALLAMAPGARRSRIGGQEMVWIWQPQERRAEGMLALGAMVLMVRGEALAGPETFESFLAALAPLLDPLP